MKVISGIYSGVTTVELDNLAAETAATMTTDHPDYGILAARLAISNLHKETKKHFSGKYFSNIYIEPALYHHELHQCFPNIVLCGEWETLDDTILAIPFSYVKICAVNSRCYCDIKHENFKSLRYKY